MNAELPTLYVCHGDEKSPRMHPCGRVQAAMQFKGIRYEKVIAGHGSPFPFLRKGSRDELEQATGDTKLPALKLPDGTVMTHSREILGIGRAVPFVADAASYAVSTITKLLIRSEFQEARDRRRRRCDILQGSRRRPRPPWRPRPDAASGRGSEFTP